MESAVLGLGAVAWTDAWKAAASEGGLRVSIDPIRLLEILHGLPASRALLADLQRAAASGRSVQVNVWPDRQIVEIATGSGHYVLTQAARNLVLAELTGHAPAVSTRSLLAPAPGAGNPNPASTQAEPSKAPPAPGILWESPSAGARHLETTGPFALPWLGPNANLQIVRDDAGGAASQEPESVVHCATLRLELPHLGQVEAQIRVCGSTVAVSIQCDDPARLNSHLAALAQGLAARGLVAAHVGTVAAGGAA